MDILEMLKTQLDGALMERLGSAVGVDAVEARRTGQLILPAQLAFLRDQTGTQAGSQQLLDLLGRLPPEGSQDPLDTPAGLEQVRQSGASLLPQLMGSRLDDTVQTLAAQDGASQSGVQGMMQMMLPLVLGMVGQQVGKLGLNAGNLGGLFTGVQGGVTGTGSGVPGAATGPGVAVVAIGSPAAAGLSSDTTRPGVGVAQTPAAVTGPVFMQGMATVGAGLNGGVLHTNPALGGRRGLGWLWLLPLLLLLLLLAWLVLRGKSVTPLTVTEPVSGAAVIGPFVVRGTGMAGQEVTMSENGQPVGKATIGPDRVFSLNAAAPGAGTHTYALTESGGEAASLMVMGAATSKPASQPADSGAVGTSTNGGFSLTTPAAGASLAAGAFDLKGTGKAGETLQIFEDGVNLGKATVGADGGWSLNVPSPSGGAHTYTVKGPAGTELGSLKTTVAAAAASTVACTRAFSLSIADGQTVAQPFRFGGVGSGKSYTVTVTRGERKVGTKVLPLDGTCGYSYTSKPGKGTVSYMVVQTGSAEVAGKITLTVK